MRYNGSAQDTRAGDKETLCGECVFLFAQRSVMSVFGPLRRDEEFTNKERK